MKPLFSIIVPTKGRPRFLESALDSLKQQSFKDFEVIVSDYDAGVSKVVFDKYSDERFRYVTPPTEYRYGMNGNWEYGMEFARGEYIGFLEDKMYFYQDTLEKVYQCICETSEPDTVNWLWDCYYFENEKVSLAGCLSRKKRSCLYNAFNRIETIRQNINFPSYIHGNGKGTGAGSILSGVIKKELVEKVKGKYGRYFNFYTPDYGPTIPILYFSKKSIMLQDNLSVAISSVTSGGRNYNSFYSSAFAFLEESPFGFDRLQFASVPFLNVTSFNLVTADYNYALYTLPELQQELGKKECCLLNVLIGVREHMNRIIYPSWEQREEEEGKFNLVLRRLTKEEFNTYQEIVSTRLVAEKKRITTEVYRALAPIVLRKYQKECEWKIFKDPRESINWI